MKREPLQLLYADATDFGTAGAGPPFTAANSLIIGTPALVQIDLTAVAANGGADQRQSDKAFLPAIPSGRWSVDACIEFIAAPADGGLVFFYWSQSPSVTPGVGNAGEATGADGVFVQTTGNLGQMRLIGTLSCINNVISIGNVGILVPTLSYGSLILINQASIAMPAAGDLDETHIVFTEIIE